MSLDFVLLKIGVRIYIPPRGFQGIVIPAVYFLIEQIIIGFYIEYIIANPV